MDVQTLCYADMLAYEDGWYIVRRIWQQPIWPEAGHALDHVGPPLTYRLLGFDLIESRTGTIRQVSANDLQTQLNEGILTFHHPKTVRRVNELR